MYHIKDDKRSRRSAAAIGNALLKCLEETDISHITITRLQQVSYVSRATFYRLFDDLTDVLTYLSDQTSRRIIDQARETDVTGFRELCLICLKTWTDEDQLLEILLDNGQIRPFCTSGFLEWTPLFAVMFPRYSETELNYITSVTMSTFVSALDTWIRTGKCETPGELLNIILNSQELVLNNLKESSVPVIIKNL